MVYVSERFLISDKLQMGLLTVLRKNKHSFLVRNGFVLEESLVFSIYIYY
jgi:hypothetical protein